jgi:Holliday junction resolvase RusA-like endonuclease
MSTIPLPWTQPPLTQNQLRRMHHMAEASTKKQALAAACLAIRAKQIPFMGGAIVILHWRMPDKRRRDGDGAAPTLKVCLDALVRVGVLHDDSWVEVPHSGITTHPPIPGRPGAMWLTVTDPDKPGGG